MKLRSATLMTACSGFLLGVAFTVGWRELRPTSPAEAGAADPADEAAPATNVDVLPTHVPQAASGLRRSPVVEAVSRASPSVVSITTEVPNQSPFRAYYNLPNQTSQGSGTIIREDGIVLTNAHVVDGAVKINATLSNSTTYEATVMGLDQALDLAVLRLEGARGLPALPLGTSADLMLGEPVIAIGNPFGLGHTVSTGVVSSPNRTLEVAERVFQDYIQTDAGINPGNSGGPLLNIHAELIGINSAIRRDAENIGFAIPVDRAAKVARDLLSYGSVRAPWLGISVTDVGGPEARGTSFAEGAVQVHSVDMPSTGQAGLHEGDIITRVDDKPIRSREDLNLRLALRHPGDSVVLEGMRKNQPFTVSIVTAQPPQDLATSIISKTLGIEVSPLDSRTARSIGSRADSGLLVTTAQPKGTFAMAGLRPGDVILAVYGVRVGTVAEFEAAILRVRAAHRASVLLTVARGSISGHIAVDL